MKQVEYELQGGEVPERLRGKVISTPVADSLAEFTAEMVENGDEAHTLRSAQSAVDVWRQGRVRRYAGTEEIGTILSGGKLTEDGTETDYGQFTQDERDAEALDRIQKFSDSIKYGARVAVAGAGKVVKEKAAKADAIAAAAASDPELAAKLAALGITI